MIEGLLATKFHNPLTVGYLTSRPRLDARLAESLLSGFRLVMITAPAGYGKSTLVSAWIGKQAAPFSWLSLDSSDNEPRIFLTYLVGALQMIDPGLGASLVNRIQTAGLADSEATLADVMVSLVNEIARLPETFYLVLDDCHLLKNAPLLRLLAFLIEHQPPQMRLVLLTREDLPLPLSRLRVRRQVVEIRQADLQFTAQEAADFLSAGMGITGLTSADILALEQRTEGWIAGLQLAALSLQHDPDPARFIQSFTGSDRYILDYLLEEVFSHQPAELQDFLLCTSILDRFCAALCDALLQDGDRPPARAWGSSTAMLEQVERANLFLIPLDNQRQWFRYHHLFADLLRHALAQADPRSVPRLHLSASRWLEENGFIPEAVQHAFRSQDWQYAAALVERHAWNMILHSQVSAVSEWCGRFPEAVIRARPVLCILHGWALIIAFKKSDFPAASVRIEQAEAALGDFDPQLRASLIPGAAPVELKKWVTGHITLLRSFILMTAPRSQASPQGLIDLAELSYQQLPADDVTGRSVALLDISYAAQARCDAAAAEASFARASAVASSGGNYFGAVVAEYHRAHGLFAQGRLRDVLAFCEQKKKLYESHFANPLQELPAIALLDQAAGCALLELNELAEAERLLVAGLKVGQWMPREELPGYLALARLYAARGDEQAMADTLRRLDMRWPDIQYCTRAMRLIYALKLHPDDADARRAAQQWLGENAGENPGENPPESGPETILPGIGPAWNDEADYAVCCAWAQMQILFNRTAEALAALQPLLDCALSHGLNHRVIELSLLQAQACYQQGQKERCWKLLRAALALAESAGYLRLLDQGPVLARLFSEAAQLGIAPQAIRRNFAAVQGDAGQPGPAASLPQKPIPAPPAAGIDGLLEPLSSREIEVLALMAAGLSNADIALRLYLSPNTLKAHSQNIYSKLDVHNRVQAVNKARELKLIP